MSALLSLAGTVRAQDAQSSESVPNDAQLHERHTRIGRILIQVDDVFEQDIRAGIYRAANAMHITTRADTVSEQLLFHSGDIYERRILDETERLLRSQRYLNAASIEPITYHDDNTVDLVVRVHDVWTLSPGISFGRKGGANSTRFEIEDTNFLGLGKHISLARTGNVDRTAWRVGYVDPNLLGSWWQLAAAYADLSDGSDSELSLARPFNSLDAHWSFNIAGADSQSEQAHYSLGEAVNRFEERRKSFDMGGGTSSGLYNGHVLRYLGGFRYQERTFDPVSAASGLVAPGSIATSSIPVDRVLAYPWVGAEWLEDQFLETRNLDQIGRTEDLYLGRKVHVELGVSAPTFGATRTSMIANGVLQSGAELGTEQYLIGSFAFNGRLENGALRNSLFDVNARYYLRHSDAQVTYASLSGTKAFRLDPEEQLLLGGDNGLRGYPLRYQAGTARALFTVEERFYTHWQPLKLVNVGAAVFFDAGRTWGVDPFAAPPLGWLTDVGAGLRLGSVRSGLGNVIHVDLAFPLNAGHNASNGPREISRMQLLIETRRSF